MKAERQTKKVAFSCPQHGILQGPVKYFSSNMGKKILVDIPVVFCTACQKYYTPFTNLLALTKLSYKGTPVMAAKVLLQRSVPRVEVRVPYIFDVDAESNRKEQMCEAEKKQAAITRKEKAEKWKEYIAGLREVSHNHIFLTNKPCFLDENKCPYCHNNAKMERVKITQSGQFVLTQVMHCNYCNSDYISPSQFELICTKAKEKIHGWYQNPFISPVEIECVLQEDGKYLFIPQWALDYAKYNHHHLPPRGDDFYDMTDEEYAWVQTYHMPEEFSVQLRKKSFLGEAGYSTSESEIRRHVILAKCVEEYGKAKVINQLKSNLNLRIKQKNGGSRYQHALNVWRGDIWYVENKL